MLAAAVVLFAVPAAGAVGDGSAKSAKSAKPQARKRSLSVAPQVAVTGTDNSHITLR